jgi:hypothetical protein
MSPDESSIQGAALIAEEVSRGSVLHLCSCWQSPYGMCTLAKRPLPLFYVYSRIASSLLWRQPGGFRFITWLSMLYDETMFFKEYDIMKASADASEIF